MNCFSFSAAMTLTNHSVTFLNDLKQMKNLEAFICLSVRDQWRLAFENKLHGRSREKKLIMDVACKVSGTSSNDALFEAIALLLPQNKQQQGRAWRTKVGYFFVICKFDQTTRPVNCKICKLHSSYYSRRNLYLRINST